jgi:hypothetical protein
LFFDFERRIVYLGILGDTWGYLGDTIRIQEEDFLLK